MVGARTAPQIRHDKAGRFSHVIIAMLIALMGLTMVPQAASAGPLGLTTTPSTAWPATPSFWMSSLDYQEHTLGQRIDVAGPTPGTSMFYCIQLGVGYAPDFRYGDADLASTMQALGHSSTTIEQVSWILAHGYTNVPGTGTDPFTIAGGPGAGTSPDIAKQLLAYATQAAIWELTSSRTFHHIGAGPNEVDAAYTVYVSKAVAWLKSSSLAWSQSTPADTTTTYGEVPSTVGLSPSALSQSAGLRMGPYTVATSAGTATISYTGGGGSTLVDAAGNPIANGSPVSNGQQVFVSVIPGAAPSTGTITVTGQPGLRTTAWTATSRQSGGGAVGVPAQSALASVTWTEFKPMSIGTSATDQADGDQMLSSVGGTIVDQVTYARAVVGSTYVVKGELMVRQPDGSALATGILASTTFTASQESGAVDLSFKVPVDYAGKTLVAFETLYASDGKTEVARHRDINDAAQTVTVETAPSLATTAKDSSDGDKTLGFSGGKVTDTVQYAGLTVGTSYVVKGELMKRNSDGTSSGTGITAAKTFTAPAPNGSVALEFVVPAGYAGDTLVAFETLFDATGATRLAAHRDINDAAQTITVAKAPTLATSATDQYDADKVLNAAGGTIADRVTYTNLVVGADYVVKGELMIREPDGGATATGITASESFTATTTNGSRTLYFVVPSGFDGKTLVAFETLYAADGTTRLAAHRDIADSAQTVTVGKAPAIATTATDQADGDKVLAAGGGTVVDQVRYSNLNPGTTYVLKGELMLRNADGSAAPSGIVATKTFTPTAPSGSTSLTFTVPAGFDGTTLVAFETLYAADGTTLVASHRDITDAAQAVTVATAFDLALRKTLAPGQGTKVAVGDNVKFQVTVFNQGTEAAHDIVVTDTLPPGTVLDDPTWKSGPGAGQATRMVAGPLAPGASTSVTITVKITEGRAGYVNTAEISAALDSTNNPGRDVDSTPDTDPKNDGPIIDNEIGKTPATGDEDDHDIATVTLANPAIGTNATDQADGDQVLAAGGGKIADKVSYANLELGLGYVLKGELMIRESDGSATATGIKATQAFTASSSNGSVTLTFVVPAGYDGRTLVAFETLYAANGTTQLAEHSEILDSAQTVSVGKAPTLATSATDQADQDKLIRATGGAVQDVVSFTNLTVGSDYIISGELMVRQANGTATPTGILASQSFTADTANGSKTLIFDVPVGYSGKTLVAFESLYAGDGTTLVAVHRDINDAAQTVNVATIFDLALRKTLASGQAAQVSVGDNVRFQITVFNQGTAAAHEIVVTDTLPPGTELNDPAWTNGPGVGQVTRTVAGSLAPGASTGLTVTVRITDGKTGYLNTAEISAALDEAGNPGRDIDSTPDRNPNNDVLIDDVINRTPANGDEDDHDIASVTLGAPSLATTASDQADGDQVLSAAGGTVSDQVRYANLAVGSDYVVRGELMIRQPDGTATPTGITASKTFTTSTANGSVTLTFTLPAGYDGKTLVAFETLFAANGTTELANHRDINDTAQTVTVGRAPTLATTATDQADGDKTLPIGGGIVVDKVTFTNLTPGTDYVLKGELMSRNADGSAKATGITATKSFSPGTANGSTSLQFMVPPGFDGQTLVAFETLYGADGATPIASHRDINDAAQTVSVTPVSTPSPSATTTTPSTPSGPPTVVPTSGSSATPVGPTSAPAGSGVTATTPALVVATTPGGGAGAASAAPSPVVKDVTKTGSKGASGAGAGKIQGAPPKGGVLPSTGSPVSAGAVVAGLMLLLAGLVLLFVGRRRSAGQR